MVALINYALYPVVISCIYGLRVSGEILNGQSLSHYLTTSVDRNPFENA